MDDLLARVTDAALRTELAKEVQALRGDRTFVRPTPWTRLPVFSGNTGGCVVSPWVTGRRLASANAPEVH